ncbi:MAG: hypothetical protein SNJ74_08505 [Fimbriimonadaceae bacterium]
MKGSFGYFLLGVCFGVAGTVLFDRLRQAGLFAEDAESVSERVLENLSELENRLELAEAEARA